MHWSRKAKAIANIYKDIIWNGNGNRIEIQIKEYDERYIWLCQKTEKCFGIFIENLPITTTLTEEKNNENSSGSSGGNEKMILWKRKENGVSNISSTIVQYILSFYDNLHSTPD